MHHQVVSMTGAENSFLIFEGLVVSQQDLSDKLVNTHNAPTFQKDCEEQSNPGLRIMNQFRDVVVPQAEPC